VTAPGDVGVTENKTRDHMLMTGRPVEIGERPWGRWLILDVGPGYCLKRIEVLPGQRLSLQYHHHRSEEWSVITGSGRILLDTEWRPISAGSKVFIPKLMRHRVMNTGTDVLVIIEIQRGEICAESDIVRLEDDYDRVSTADTDEKTIRVTAVGP
jgi:mannose-6-phosphate isomerase